jgi:hypothetical protein
MAQAVFWRREALVAFSTGVRDEGVAVSMKHAVQAEQVGMAAGLPEFASEPSQHNPVLYLRR